MYKRPSLNDFWNEITTICRERADECFHLYGHVLGNFTTDLKGLEKINMISMRDTLAITLLMFFRKDFAAKLDDLPRKVLDRYTSL